MASSTGCGVVVNGTNCLKTWGTTAPSIGPSKDGKLAVSSPGFGRSSNPAVGSWAGWPGNGSPPTPRWGKPGLGGPDWAQPHGPRQGGDQAEPAGREGGGSIERSAGWGQCPRYQASGGNPGGHRSRASPAQPGEPPEPVPG